MPDPLDRRLAAWVAAGIITAAQADAIARLEARERPATPPHERLGASEALTYAGVATVVAGLLYLLFSSTTDSTATAVIGLMALAAAAAGVVLARGGTVSSARAADACLALAAGLAGVTVGETAAIAGWLDVTTTTCFGDACSTEVEHAGPAALGAAASMVAAAVWLPRHGRTLLGLAAAGSAETFALVLAWHPLEGGALARSACALAAAAVLLAAGRVVPPTAVEPMRLVAILTSMVILYGTDPDDHIAAGGVIAGLVAAAALAAAVRLDSNALVVGGGLGLFGFCIDATVRQYHGDRSVPVVLIVGGVALVACAALVQWGVRRNATRRRAGPPAPAAAPR